MTLSWFVFFLSRPVCVTDDGGVAGVADMCMDGAC